MKIPLLSHSINFSISDGIAGIGVTLFVVGLIATLAIWIAHGGSLHHADVGLGVLMGSVAQLFVCMIIASVIENRKSTN